MYNRLNVLGKMSSYFHPIWILTKYTTIHALIHLTDEMRNETDGRKYAFGIFVGFRKAFKN